MAGGCVGFGGPPTHIKLQRDLCVERWEMARSGRVRGRCRCLQPVAWASLDPAGDLLRRRLGAIAGGAAFIVPGLILILALAVLFLSGSPPRWITAAGDGAGAAIPAVAGHAAAGLLPASWRAACRTGRARQLRWIGYLASGVIAAAALGPWLVLVLLACGAIEVVTRILSDHVRPAVVAPISLAASGIIAPAGWRL